MGDPVMEARGVANRGTADRRPVRALAPPSDYPPFDVRILGLAGASAIPDALAWALKWQLELMHTSDPDKAKELADKLIAVWEWLQEMEVTAPRAPDGALLVNDRLAVWANAKVQTRLVELSTGEAILVETSRVEAPLPVWQPTLFPPDLPPYVKADYPARPASVDDIPPFFKTVVERWMVASVRPEGDVQVLEPPAPPPAPGETGVVVPNYEVRQPETEIEEDKEEAEKAMEAAARKVDLSRWNAERLAAFKGITPTVNAAIARLRSTTLDDITRHTGVKFDRARADEPLINHTKFILYHSVYSFVLDVNGEPLDLRYRRDGDALFPYPILIEEPGEQMQRSAPVDDGVYISVQKYGFGKFRLNDEGITKLLFGTVGGFTEYGYGYSGPHRIQKALQGYLDRDSSYGFVAGISVPGLFEQQEITWSRIKSRIPDFVEVVIPYLVKEVIARASDKLENWEKFAEEIIETVIQELILDKIKKKIRDYLIKKVGARIVPGLNAVSALVDLFTGGDERTRIRHILACMIVALRSDHEEDLHIAAKVCAKVTADEFEKALMNALIEKSKKGAAKLAHKSKAKREAAERAAMDKPAEAPSPAPDRPKEPAAAQRAKPQAAAQPVEVNKDRVPPSVGSPASNAGATATTSSAKTGDTSPPKVASTATEAPRKPRPPTKAEEAMLERARKKQEAHDEKIARKKQELKEAEQKKKEEEQQLAANGGNATGDTGTSSASKGVDAKNTEGTGTPAKPPAKPPAKVPDPNKPKKPLKPLPEPEPGYIHVKEPDPVQDTDVVQGERKIRTGGHDDPTTGRAQSEQNAGLMGVGEQAHHGAQKKGAGDAGDETREALQTAGVSINTAANMVPARGLSDDPRAVHGSSAAHSSMHGPYDAETMRRIAVTRKDDPEGLESAMADYNQALYEGRRPARDDFYLGDDPPPKPKRSRKKKEKDEDPEPEEPEQ